MTADEKYGKPFDFEPFCKLIFSMNELPRIDDKTDAPYRRMLIINYEKQFSRQEQNRNLYKQLQPEISGIFNWMIRGLVRLYERGDFEFNEEMEDIINEYKKDNNPTLVFVEEKLEKQDGSSASKKDIYKEYSRWCSENGHHATSDKKLTKQIRSYFKKEIDEKSIYEDRTSQSRTWNGLRIQNGYIVTNSKEEWQE